MTRLMWHFGILVLCMAVGCSSTDSGPENPGGNDNGNGNGLWSILNGDDDGPPDQADNGDEDQGESSSGYRKVTLAGTVTTDNDEASVNLEPGAGMTAFEYIGDYQIELWFPMAGGEAVQQRNWIALREGGHIPVYYGTATECDYTPYADAYEERSFELEATLTLNGLLLDDEPADELSIHLPTWPSYPITVNVLCPFGTPADVTDPGPYTQLLLYWYMNTIVQAMQLDRVTTNTWTDIPMIPPYGMYFLTVSQNANYTSVSSLD